jgi:hypothetical protein
MNVSRAGLVLVIVVAATLASEPVLARGKGGAGGGRSGHHSGAGRSAHHSGVHHQARIFAGGLVAAPAFWPWWNYPAYQFAGAYPAAPLYYIEQSDEAAAPAGEWLYCDGANAYFPYVIECPGGWRRVSPHAPSG